MLNEWSDRSPKPPNPWEDTIIGCIAIAMTALLFYNIYQNISGWLR